VTRGDVVAAPAVVTAGETMLLGVPPRPGRLRHARSLELGIGGAESNVAIALSRLGVPARWVSLLGDDEPGQFVLDRVRAEGVDTWVRRLPDRPTGLYLREEVGGSVRVTYYRQGSAAAALSPETVDPAALDGATWLHVSGVTPALSPECADLIPWLASQARSRGVLVSYDVNYRSRLWDAEEARRFTESVLPLVDLLLVGTEEGRALWDWRGDEKQARWFAEHGPGEVVVKRGDAGAAAYVDGELLEVDAYRVTQVDPIGAGDAFAAGYLAGHVWGLPPEERLVVANAMGAICVRAHGDYEGLPSRRELDDFLANRSDLGR
jgi:2-dehydro-3-deoxygluconokinase